MNVSTPKPDGCQIPFPLKLLTCFYAKPEYAEHYLNFSIFCCASLRTTFVMKMLESYISIYFCSRLEYFFRFWWKYFQNFTHHSKICNETLNTTHIADEIPQNRLIHELFSIATDFIVRIVNLSKILNSSETCSILDGSHFELRLWSITVHGLLP